MSVFLIKVIYPFIFYKNIFNTVNYVNQMVLVFHNINYDEWFVYLKKKIIKIKFFIKYDCFLFKKYIFNEQVAHLLFIIIICWTKWHIYDSSSTLLPLPFFDYWRDVLRFQASTIWPQLYHFHKFLISMNAWVGYFEYFSKCRAFFFLSLLSCCENQPNCFLKCWTLNSIVIIKISVYI